VNNAMTSDGVTAVAIVGGTAAVSNGVAAEINAIPAVGDIMRISGADRYETAIEIAKESTAFGLRWSHVALATGRNFPDALAGGPLQARDASVMVLTGGETLEPDVATALADNTEGIYEIRYLGGTSVIEPAVRTSAEALLY
jgi:putative cell wall-binding protein